MASIQDDFSNTSATLGKVKVGASATGVIENYGDSDWFRITLEPLVVYKFTLLGSAGSNWANTFHPADLAIVDPIYSPDINLVARAINGYGAEPIVLAQVERGGDYFIDVNSYHPGAYTVSATVLSRDDYSSVARPSAVVLAVGGQRSGAIEVTSDMDTFRIQLEGGKTYLFSADGVAGTTGHAGAPKLGVLGDYPGFKFNSWQESPVSVYAPVSGTYYVTIHDANYGTGDYIVKASLAPDDYLGSAATSTTLAIGASRPGKIEAPEDRDCFKINVTAGVTYNFLLRDATNSTAMSVDDGVMGMTGMTTHAIQGLGLVTSWTPSKSGIYYLTAYLNSLGDFTAKSYTLETSVATHDDYPGNAGTTGILASNGTVQGRLETLSDTDWIRVELTAGTGYTFHLSNVDAGNGTLTTLRTFNLYNSNGNLVQQAVPNQASSDAPQGTLLAYQPTASGSYFLEVDDPFNKVLASYSISSTTTANDTVAGDISTSAIIKPGDALRSAIDFVTDKDWYKAELKAGEIYSFVVDGLAKEGGTLELVELHLFDGSGKAVTNTTSIYQETGFTFRPSTAGTYYIEVATQSQGSGSYTVKMGDTTTPLQDTMGPRFKWYYQPGQQTGNIVKTDVEIIFNEAIKAGSGTIKLSLAGGALLESFDIKTSTALTWDSGDPTKLIVSPTAGWLPNTEYNIQFPAGVVSDTHGNLLASNFTLAFRQVDVPIDRIGTDGNDAFRAGSGPDKFDGGLGVDAVTFAGSFDSYSFEGGYTNLSLVALTNYYDRDKLISIERLHFADMSMALDVKGSAGQVYRMYQAAFNRVPDKAGLGFWLKYVDEGLSMKDAAKQFMASPEFKSLLGHAPSNDTFINKMYENVLHRAPEKSGYDFWMQAMQNGTTSAEVLQFFSESPENQAAVIGSIQGGIFYLPLF